MDVRNRKSVSQPVARSNREKQKVTPVCNTCNGRGWVYSRAYSPCTECDEMITIVNAGVRTIR